MDSLFFKKNFVLGKQYPLNEDYWKITKDLLFRQNNIIYTCITTISQNYLYKYFYSSNCCHWVITRTVHFNCALITVYQLCTNNCVLFQMLLPQFHHRFDKDLWFLGSWIQNRNTHRLLHRKVVLLCRDKIKFIHIYFHEIS